MPRKKTALSNELSIEERELLELRRRWLKAKGEEMPLDIQEAPLTFVRRAVELTEAGHTVFIPKAPVSVSRPPEFGRESSMMEWDANSNN